MKTISVAELRQNPAEALAEVERGETYVITRYRREIGRIVPPVDNHLVTPTQFEVILRRTLIDEEWSDELRDHRKDFDSDGDPWKGRG